MYCALWSNEAATVHANIAGGHCDVPAPVVSVDRYIHSTFSLFR